jgi:deazaflavin-dependent oxidoreductase (nitroreductase family)
MFGLRQFSAAHVALYRATGGIIGGKMGVSILLLDTIGRKSGKAYTHPLAFYTTEQGNHIIFASNNAGVNHPAWYFNLMAMPSTTIQIMRHTYTVRAVELEGEARAIIWEKVRRWNPFWEGYEGKTTRRIPLIQLQVIE